MPQQPPIILSDNDKNKLVGIVREMTANGESDDVIQRAVDLYKSGVKKKDDITAPLIGGDGLNNGLPPSPNGNGLTTDAPKPPPSPIAGINFPVVDSPNAQNGKILEKGTLDLAGQSKNVAKTAKKPVLKTFDLQDGTAIVLPTFTSDGNILSKDEDVIKNSYPPDVKWRQSGY
jgi:hypothetical protein